MAGKRKSEEISTKSNSKVEDKKVLEKKENQVNKKLKVESTNKGSLLSNASEIINNSIYTKKRVLFTSTRGIGSKHRHLMQDLISLIPHSKKEIKVDDRESISMINETCEMKSCNYAVLFDTRHNKDLYLWMAKAPLGPTIRFQVTNVHTLDELQMTGNALKGSRPFLHFDKSFDSKPHLKITKGILSQIFSTPKGHVKSKPFFDHIFSFFYQDGRIWFRNYQISDQEFKSEPLLTEIGPRMILNIEKIFSSGFGGSLLYSNPEVKSSLDNQKQLKYAKIMQKDKSAKKYEQSKERRASAFIPAEEMDTVFD